MPIVSSEKPLLGVAAAAGLAIVTHVLAQHQRGAGTLRWSLDSWLDALALSDVPAGCARAHSSRLAWKICRWETEPHAQRHVIREAVLNGLVSILRPSRLSNTLFFCCGETWGPIRGVCSLELRVDQDSTQQPEHGEHAKFACCGSPQASHSRVNTHKARCLLQHMHGIISGVTEPPS